MSTEYAARGGYCAYRDAHNGTDERGLPIPLWRDLDDETRAEWLAAADNEKARTP